jgi:hypothetical protein
MIPTHLDAYQIALIAWGFVLALYGVQGVLSVWLEGRELKLKGQGERPREPLWVLVVILALTALELLLAVRFVLGLPTAPARQLALDAGLLFMVLAVMLVLYRKYYVADEVMAQERDDGVPW